MNIRDVKRKYEKSLLLIEGVISVGISKDGIVVTVTKTNEKIPSELDGIPIIIQISKKFEI